MVTILGMLVRDPAIGLLERSTLRGRSRGRQGPEPVVQMNEMLIYVSYEAEWPLLSSPMSSICPLSVILSAAGSLRTWPLRLIS